MEAANATSKPMIGHGEAASALDQTMTTAARARHRISMERELFISGSGVPP